MKLKYDFLKTIFSRIGLGIIVLMLFVYAQCPTPILNSPQNEAISVIRPVVFNWSSIEGAKSYRLQVAIFSNGWDKIKGFLSQYLVLDVITTGTFYTWPGAEAGKTYYWSVLARDSQNQSGEYTQYFSFTTAPLPLVNFSGSPQSGYAPLKVLFLDQSQAGTGGTISSWNWNLGDGSSSSIQNPIHTYQNEGTYSVTLTVTDSFGNTKTETKSNYIMVSLQPSTPIANFIGNPTFGNSPLNVVFSDQSQAGADATLTSWNWSFGDGGTSSSQNPNHTYQAVGTYSVTLTVTNSFGNTKTETKSNYITVSLQPSTPIANFIGNPTSGNAPLTVVFSDQSQAGADATLTSWNWSFGDGEASSSQNPTHTYQVVGTYTVTLTVTNSFGNTKTETKSNYITVSSQPSTPTADFISNSTTGNTPLTVVFLDKSKAGTGATITGWKWDFGDGATSLLQNPGHTYQKAGKYTVKLTVTNSFGNSKTKTKSNYITVTTDELAPTADFVGNPISGKEPLKVQFSDKSKAMADKTIKKWKWDFGDGMTNLLQNPGHTYQTAGKYTVKLTVTDSSDKTDDIIKIDYIYVVQNTVTPQIDLNRNRLNFGASTQGQKTSDEKLTIRNIGGGILNWSVNSNESWIKLSPQSGPGYGTVIVSAESIGLAPGTHSGTVMVTAPGAVNSPKVVSITLNVYPAGNTSPPFGDFATPLDGSTVYGSIAVTGWILDDIEVSNVKIYNGESYVGEAVFVEGARPDVEQAYPGYPMNYKAGWGYMLLTNALPYKGNGKYTIFAKAIDKEGNIVTLGSKTINCDNEHAVKPFGAIDTPAQGDTASGKKYVNNGWVLTPLPNYIPKDGSTISVFIDGKYVGHPYYDIYRPDIAHFFPFYYNSLGAGASFTFDTTKYADGFHTIAWIVVDNTGNTEGIGSRFFEIINGDKKQQSNDFSGQHFKLGLEQDYDWLLQNMETIPLDYSSIWFKQGYDMNTGLNAISPDDNGMFNIEIPELERIEIHLSELDDYEGEGEPNPNFDIKASIQRDFNKNRSSCRGYSIVGDQSRELPAGSTLDTDTGVFYWQPGPGFVGKYRLFFITETQDGTLTQKNCTITIKPKS